MKLHNVLSLEFAFNIGLSGSLSSLAFTRTGMSRLNAMVALYGLQVNEAANGETLFITLPLINHPMLSQNFSRLKQDRLLALL
jgi:hypothetical protein